MTFEVFNVLKTQEKTSVSHTKYTPSKECITGNDVSVFLRINYCAGVCESPNNSSINGRIFVTH